jgi:CheY-like chemotaxis protein
MSGSDAPSAGSLIRTVIVDDSAFVRKVVREILSRSPFIDVVGLARDGHEALAMVQELKPDVVNRHDVVLLDMVMHGMYGLEVLTKFRQLNPQLPVIIVTADIQKSTRDQVKAAGAAGIVNKPLHREELAAILTNVLSGGVAWN